MDERSASIEGLLTMPTVLKRGEKIPLNFTSGTILVLKPTRVSKAPLKLSESFELSFFNEKGDLLLQIWFSTRSIVCTERACSSRWGKQLVDMTQVDLKGRSLLEVEVSVHHHLTDSEFGRYQFLLGGITICHFDKCLPGPATEIIYEGGAIWGPASWYLEVCQIDDLLPEDGLALVSGR